MAQLTARNLTLGYDNMTVSQDINFEVNRGDYLCIVGENGSGKSTLIKTLAGLTPSISGEIIYGDGLSPSTIGYLPQQTPIQKDFPASVGEIVLSGCLSSAGMRPYYTAEEKNKARASMEKLAILNLKNKCYRNLSGGQQQRVLLARALCATSKMILLDEPEASLDPAATAEMYEIVKNLNENEHITVIMVSHDIEAAIRYAGHILHMGRSLQFFGSKEDYINSPIKISFRHNEEFSKLIDKPLCSRSKTGKSRRYFR